jgi:hypothetical protein
LNLPKFTTNSIETYECVADNGIGDALRKTITIYFSGKTSLKVLIKPPENIRSNLKQNVALLYVLSFLFDRNFSAIIENILLFFF